MVGENVTIGHNAVLHPHVVIYEGASIGDDFYAHSHAVVREYCRVGNRVTLQNGVIVGGDGYGFAKRADGTHDKIVQSGVTVIEDDVEIQTLTSVDRATMGETRVKRGAKIDSLVQVGHGCVVGEDNIICAQTGLAGSSILGKNVLLAGQVGVSGHLTIHDNAVVYAQSGVGRDVEPGAVISGSPAFEAREWLRAITAFPKLPEILRTMRQLEKRCERWNKPRTQRMSNSARNKPRMNERHDPASRWPTGTRSSSIRPTRAACASSASTSIRSRISARKRFKTPSCFSAPRARSRCSADGRYYKKRGSWRGASRSGPTN